MYLTTIYQLNIESESIVSEGDTIKIYLRNGEILIGEYSSSDYTELCIERDCEDIWIVFDNIDKIEVE